MPATVVAWCGSSYPHRVQTMQKRGMEEPPCQKLCLWPRSVREYEPWPGRVWKIFGQRTRKALRWEDFNDGWKKGGLEGLRAALRLKR